FRNQGVLAPWLRSAVHPGSPRRIRRPPGGSLLKWLFIFASFRAVGPRPRCSVRTGPRRPRPQSEAKMSISRKTRAYVACTIAWVLASSCDEGSADEGEFPLDDGPAYVVATRVWDDTSITSYFHVLPSLE